ncbi:hypothetical protein SDC9_104189 [bioreactor metagenome]|uniref:Uncharacterized protein n=1 Tax=bioreactor metagenome TaxID=1076179 RepID=A0A645AW38_9ZZZZ
MHTVGDITDGNIFFFAIRPHEVPHLAGNMAVQLRNGVGALRKAQGQHGHNKGLTPGLCLAAEVNKLIAAHA